MEEIIRPNGNGFRLPDEERALISIRGVNHFCLNYDATPLIIPRNRINYIVLYENNIMNDEIINININKY